MKCEGIECFNPDYSANSKDCLNGGCYVGINSQGETKRDCAINQSTTACATNDNQAANCLVCQDDFCNGISFPIKNRLICKECRGYSCDENGSEDKYCESLNQAERCVSVFNSAGRVLERGCSTTIQSAAYCNASESNCLKCSFNSCNVQTSMQQKYYCVSCDSNDEPGCIMNSATVGTKACTTNQCFSRLLTISSGSPWQYVVKGCAADLPTSYNCTGPSCSICTGDRCNNVLYPSNRFSCLSCRNDECKNATTKTCELYHSLQQGCVTLYNSNNEVNFRGCYSDVAEGTKNVCDDTSDLLCTKCTTANCNRDTVRRGRKCFKCEGIGCFQPDFPADTVDCLSDCYTGINSLGENVRGCESSFANTTICGDDDGTKRCNVCTDDFCNGEKFPTVNRLQCHTCVNENCQATEDNLELCEIYHQKERCVTVLSHEDKVVERGCSSSLRNLRYCNQNYENCLKCAASGCNVLNSRVERACVVCNSGSNSNCVLNPASIATSGYCSLGCYTRLVNETLYRGCSDELAASFVCSEANNCKHCNDFDKCNTITFPSDRKSCQACSGTANCKNSTSQLCINYKKNDSCVTVFQNCKLSFNPNSVMSFAVFQTLFHAKDVCLMFQLLTKQLVPAQQTISALLVHLETIVTLTQFKEMNSVLYATLLWIQNARNNRVKLKQIIAKFQVVDNVSRDFKLAQLFEDALAHWLLPINAKTAQKAQLLSQLHNVTPTQAQAQTTK